MGILTYQITIFWVKDIFLWFLIVKMFSLIYGTPRNSSRFERYSCLELVTLVSGVKPHGVVAWVIEMPIINNFYAPKIPPTFTCWSPSQPKHLYKSWSSYPPYVGISLHETWNRGICTLNFFSMKVKKLKFLLSEAKILSNLL